MPEAYCWLPGDVVLCENSGGGMARISICARSFINSFTIRISRTSATIESESNSSLDNNQRIESDSAVLAKEILRT